jgi:hypothetical protein
MAPDAYACQVSRFSPSHNSPIDRFALYAPPRERVRGAVSVLDEGKDLRPERPERARGEGTYSATSSTRAVAGPAVELTMRIPLVARKPQTSTLGELT